VLLLILALVAIGVTAQETPPNSPKAAVNDLRNKVRDPDSFVLERAWIMPNKWGGILCVTYRAKNGFGGYNRELAVYNHKGGRKANETTPFQFEGSGDDMGGGAFTDPNSRMCHKKNDDGIDVTKESR